MNAELLMIGTELLLGQIHDTNAAWMAQTLALHGINLYQKTTVGDNRERIIAALDAALTRSDVVLCSGGLGPTEDDITRECIAELLGRPLEFRVELWESVLARFSQFRTQVTENNKKQATLPAGAIAVENPHGTAPGVIIDDPRGIIACMPGVPMELKPMLEERILPYLLQRFGIQGVLQYRVLKVCGVGESRVDSMIGSLIAQSSNPSIGLLASPDVVRIRIAARAATREAAEALIDPVDAAVRERMGGLIMGVDEDTLETVVDRLLTGRGWRLGVIETITGGMIALRLTAAGAKSFARGLVVPGTEGAVFADRGLDPRKSLLLDSALDCVLAVVADPVERTARAIFESPLGRDEWVISHLGPGERSQIRTSVFAMERVRRLLTGVRAPF